MATQLRIHILSPRFMGILVSMWLLSGCRGSILTPLLTPGVEPSNPLNGIRITPSPPTNAPTPTSTITQSINPLPTTEAPSVPTPTVVEPYGVWHCWDDGSADPCHRLLNNLSLSSNNEGWIVGEAGAILHWDGQKWKAVKNPNYYSLEIIESVGLDDAWAVGAVLPYRWETKYFLHWDGNNWRVFDNPVPFDGTVMDISFAGKANGWAIVYENGPSSRCFLYHWDGLAWIEYLETFPLFALEMVNEDNGWAVGALNVKYRWDGETWKLYQPPLPGGATLTSVSFISNSVGWATRSDGIILRWSDSQWIEMDLNYGSPIKIVMANASDGWLISDDNDTAFRKLFKWDGLEWRPYEGDFPSLTDDVTFEIATQPNGEAWAVLWAGNSQIWHWDGVAWTPYQASLRPNRALAMDLLTEDNIWIVGDDGYIGHWDGNQIKQIMISTTATLNDVTFIDQNNGWIVGDDSTILHRNGSKWHLFPVKLEDVYLKSIRFVDAEDGWIVGSYGGEGGGALYLHWDGHTWEVPGPSLVPWYDHGGLTSLSLVDASHGWATGGYEDSIVYWDGQTWSRVPNPANYWLYSISIVRLDNAWAVGYQAGVSDEGIVLHWDGHEWKDFFRTPGLLTTVTMLSGDEGWMAGSEIYHWDGISWQEVNVPISDRIVGFEVGPSGRVWALTSAGVLLYFGS